MMLVLGFLSMFNILVEMIPTEGLIETNSEEVEEEPRSSQEEDIDNLSSQIVESIQLLQDKFEEKDT